MASKSITEQEVVQHLIFDETNDDIDWSEFADFMSLFARAYDKAFVAPALPTWETLGEPKESALARRKRLSAIIRERQKARKEDLLQVAGRPVRPPLKIRRISKNSPLEIWLLGLATAVTAAAILSGGQAEFLTLKFKLPPLGEGIRRLREALKRDEPTRGVAAIASNVPKAARIAKAISKAKSSKPKKPRD